MKPFLALLDYARIKSDLSVTDERLLTALKDPVTGTANPNSLLFTLTLWDKTSLNDTLAHFASNAAGLNDFEMFRRVYEAFGLIQAIGISAAKLIAAITNEPNASIVRDLQAALRARYDAADWRDIIKPINNDMRMLQRDALVAYILHQMTENPASLRVLLDGCADGALHADFSHPSRPLFHPALYRALPYELGAACLSGIYRPGPLEMDEALSRVGSQP